MRVADRCKGIPLAVGPVLLGLQRSGHKSSMSSRPPDPGPKCLQFLRRFAKSMTLTPLICIDLGLHVNQIRRYESEHAQPSLEALKKIAVGLSVSIDTLVFENNERGPDEDLRLQFEAVSRMPAEEKKIVKALLEGMIVKYQTKQMVGGLSS